MENTLQWFQEPWAAPSVPLLLPYHPAGSSPPLSPRWSRCPRCRWWPSLAVCKRWTGSSCGMEKTKLRDGISFPHHTLPPQGTCPLPPRDTEQFVSSPIASLCSLPQIPGVPSPAAISSTSPDVPCPRLPETLTQIYICPWIGHQQIDLRLQLMEQPMTGACYLSSAWLCRAWLQGAWLRYPPKPSGSAHPPSTDGEEAGDMPRISQCPAGSGIQSASSWLILTPHHLISAFRSCWIPN